MKRTNGQEKIFLLAEECFCLCEPIFCTLFHKQSVIIFFNHSPILPWLHSLSETSNQHHTRNVYQTHTSNDIPCFRPRPNAGQYLTSCNVGLEYVCTIAQCAAHKTDLMHGLQKRKKEGKPLNALYHDNLFDFTLCAHEENTIYDYSIRTLMWL